MLVLHEKAKYGENWYLTSEEKTNLKRIRDAHIRRIRINAYYNYRQCLTIQQMNDFFSSHCVKIEEEKVLTKK